MSVKRKKRSEVERYIATWPEWERRVAEAWLAKNTTRHTEQKL